MSGVSNANPGKRSRVSRACDQCRTAREKCDGRPVCSTCSNVKRTCTYATSIKKRGIQPGYIRTLELALTWLFQNSEAESLLHRKLVSEGQGSVLLSKDSKESNRLHRKWRSSKFCRNVDKLLAGEAIEHADDRTPQSDEPESDAEPTPAETMATQNAQPIEPPAPFIPHQIPPTPVQPGEVSLVVPVEAQSYFPRIQFFEA